MSVTNSYGAKPSLGSWLIDVDQDAEGLRVIVDLHGGDEQNEMAQAEYTEIKDKVVSEVRIHTVHSSDKF